MKCPSCGAEIAADKVCKYCGTQIMDKTKEENDQTKTVRPRKTWLWVLGWIVIFPLPLTLILMKKNKMNPILKYGMIAAAWILFIVIIISGNKNNGKMASDEQSVPSSSIAAQTDSEPTSDLASFSEKQDEENAETEDPSVGHQVYVLTGEDLGQYGKKLVLNKDTDLPVEKYLYKLPAGTYRVTTTNTKMSSFFIVKDEIGIDPDNSDYPEVLQYVGEGGYLLTAGENDFNGNAKKSVTVTLKEDESFQLVYSDTFIFEQIEE